MSSAANHRARSHRSEYRARPFHTGARRAIGAVTPKKRGHFNLIDMIRRHISARRIARAAAGKVRQDTPKDA